MKKISLLLLLTSFVPLIHMDYSKTYETLSFIDEMVSKHKFEKSYLVEIFKSAEKREKIINSMNRPTEKKFAGVSIHPNFILLFMEDDAEISMVFATSPRVTDLANRFRCRVLTFAVY